MPPNLHIFPAAAPLYRAAAARWAESARAAVAARGRFHVALSGGATPRGLFEALAAGEGGEVPWRAVEVWFGDERCVPYDHPDSNYRMAREALLDRVPVDPARLHPMPATLARLRLDALRYGEALAAALPAAGGVPQFDLIMLGLGPDGHIASLFPGSCLLRERHRPVGAVYVDRLRAWRVSITYPVIEAARRLLFLAAGESKAAPLGRLFGRLPAAGPPLPVERIAAQGEVEWFIDEAAAVYLKGETE